MLCFMKPQGWTGYVVNDIVFDQDKINDLANVRHILIEGAILNLSLDSTLIDYYPDYSLELQLGVQAELNMSISDQTSNNNYR